MIYFDKEQKIFYLNTKNTAYAMGILENSVLVHLYWGEKISNTLSADMAEDFNARSLSARDFGARSTDNMPLEFSTFGSVDTRCPTFSCKYADGSRISRFKYCDYEIINGKPELEGLPSVYSESRDKTDTLVIHLVDELKNVHIYLNYSVLEDFDAITRSMKIVNGGDVLDIESALSMSVDFFAAGEKDAVHLDGAWARERHITREPVVYGDRHIESRYGASSAMHNPFIALCDKNADENIGNVYAFSLVYSGNFTAGVELDPYNCARAYIGINPFGFDWKLETGESFVTPEAVLVYSANGFGDMSRIFHKLYRTRLCRGKYRDTRRFALINNWEATYFDFNEEKIVDIAKKASEIGVDTMVLDDGWFGKRITDNAGLGDWVENPDRLPNGLKGLAEKVNALGMRFGLWFEPEMVNPDSDLYRAHPDWVLHTKGRESHLTRNQLTLDLSRKDVCDYIIDSVSAVLKKANIEYVKWDMNRYMSEADSALLSSDRKGEIYHRYILGLYYVLESITSAFPNVLFESCASGGGRFDAGMLHYMPQTWTSDDSDAVERLFIQYGTSYVYPYSSMGAHVSVCPNHQVGRTTPFEMRCNVALRGQFGFELDLNKCSESELETAKQAVKTYRELQPVFHFGDCYRLVSPFENDYTVSEFVSEDKNTVIVCMDSIKAVCNAGDERILLNGLDGSAIYVRKDNGKSYSGDYLMKIGLLFVNGREHLSKMLIFERQ